MTTISALIPTYNRRTNVFRAIESVLAQTTLVDEIIVIDDGSTDGTADAIRRQYGSRVVLIEQKNAGVSAARNAGLRAAQGEWIAFLDSDDVWSHDKLALQLEALTELGSSFGVCITDCRFVGNCTLVPFASEDAGLSSRLRFSSLDNPLKHVVHDRTLIYSSTVLVLRSLALQVRGFDEAMPFGEDVDFYFKLAMVTQFCFVSLSLVDVDRTPSLARLTGVLATQSEQMYSCSDYRFRKWLADPQLTDIEVRDKIRAQLLTLTYSWVTNKIYTRRFAEALGKVNDIRDLGDSYSTAARTLVSRATTKLFRSLGFLGPK